MLLLSFLLLPAVAVAAPPFGGRAAAEGPAAGAEPVQIRIRMEQVLLRKGALSSSHRRDMAALLRRGWLTGAGAARLREGAAGAETAGQAATTDVLNLTTLEGVAAGFHAGGKGGPPEQSISIVPRFDGDRIAADVELVHAPRRGRVSPRQTDHRTVTVPKDGWVALRVPPAGDATSERIVFLRFSRLDP